MHGAVMEESRVKLRNVALSQRRALAPVDCLAWSQAIQARAIQLPHYRAARSVALYSPVQNEVATQAILDDALRAKKIVYYPKLSSAGAPVFARIDSYADLVVGRFGIPEPAGTDTLSPADWGGLIVFVPGLSFDRRGNRLGRGGGWYDRVLGELKNHSVFIGLAYEMQMVGGLLTESWDQRVNFIITENNLIDCGNRPQ